MAEWGQEEPGERMPVLFINETGSRLKSNGIPNIVTKQAQRVGLYDPGSSRVENHFTPHCFG